VRRRRRPMDVMRSCGAPLVALALAATACSGARHRKPVGPPPDYELPEEPDGWPPPASATARTPRDAGPQ
jgi:hypothetical protein